MLSQISWYNYILYSLSIIGIYYSYVLFIYYGREIRGLMLGTRPAKQRQSDSAAKKDEQTIIKSAASPEAVEEVFSHAMILSESIKSVFQEISFKEATKEELFVMLHKQIDKYPLLHATPFRVAIQNLIWGEATKYQIDLGEDQKAINALWDGV